MKWGLLAPEQTESSRRVRGLNITRAVRAFNEVAVPNMGGMWFAKQLLWPMLGIHTATELSKFGTHRFNNIPMSNAIEALACLLALKNEQTNEPIQSDARLVGREKLANCSNQSFTHLSKTSTYVSQPMRRSVVQALRGLGLVEAQSSRYNTYLVSDKGKKFIEIIQQAYEGQKPQLAASLNNWVMNPDFDNFGANEKRCNRKLLSPLTALPETALGFIKEIIMSGEHRRRNVFQWLEHLERNPSENHRDWANRPAQLDAEHWSELQAGAYFFKLRQLALKLLNATEALIQKESIHSIDLHDASVRLSKSILELKAQATLFLNMNVDPTPSREASIFGRECVKDSPSSILSSLIARDGRVLTLRGENIYKNPAFAAALAENEDEQGYFENIQSSSLNVMELFPENISFRIKNMYLLQLDLKGQLNEYLNPQGRPQ